MFKFLRKNNTIDGNWLKVSDLKVGMLIAVPKEGILDMHKMGTLGEGDIGLTQGQFRDGGDVLWDEIESIEYVGTEQVWDIEVEDTHNFVGNNIFAHNTYIENGNLGVGYDPRIITGTGNMIITGNVGIGTTAPGYPLEVSSASTTLTNSILARFANTAVNAYLAVDGVGTSGVLLRESNIDSWQFKTSSGDFVLRKSGIADVLTAVGAGSVANTLVLKSGNVGIGTTNPTSLLSIYKGGAGVTSEMNIQAGTNGVPSSTNKSSIQFNIIGGGGGLTRSYIYNKYNGANSDLNIEPANNTIFTSGNVGIGTTSPTAAKLVVSTTGTADNINLDSTGSGVTGLSLSTSGVIKGYWATARANNQFLTDAQTGDMIFRSESNNILFGVGSTNATMAINNGKVGIGMTGPTTNLDVTGKGLFGTLVSGRGSYLGTLSLQNIANTETSIHMWQSGIASGVIGFPANNSDLYIVNSYDDGLITDPHGMVIKTNGNVGIGDAAPGTKLSVVGNAAIGYASGQTAPANGLIINGNVGIGTTSPNATLDVLGTIGGKGKAQFTLTGLLTTTANSAIVTGVGTKFLSEVSVGDFIEFYGDSSGYVKSIESDTSLTFEVYNYLSEYSLAATIDKSLLSLRDSSGAGKFIVDSDGNLTAGTVVLNGGITSTYTGYNMYAGKFAIDGGKIFLGDASNSSAAIRLNYPINWANINYDNIRDTSTVTPTNDIAHGGTTNTAFASVDVSVQAGSIYNYGHLGSYQDRMTLTGSGTVGDLRGFWSWPQLLNGTGITTTVTNRYGFMASDFYTNMAGGPLALTNNYGFYVEPLTKGTNNFAVYTAGATKSYFGGSIGIGTTANGYNNVATGNRLIVEGSVGIGMVNPSQKLSVKGNINTYNKFIAGNTPIVVSFTPVIDAAEYYLPSASESVGKVYKIINTQLDSYEPVNIYPVAGELILGDSTNWHTNYYEIANDDKYTTVMIYSDGVNWNILSDEESGYYLFDSWKLGLSAFSSSGIQDTADFQIKNLKNSTVPFSVLASNGNVGIGTTAPGAKLTVSNGNSGNIAPSLTYGSVALTTFNSGQVELATGTSNTSPYGFWMQTRTSNNLIWPLLLNPLGGGVAVGYTDPGTAALAINGNVGIGTTGPLVKLHIAGSLADGNIGTQNVLMLERPYQFGVSHEQAASFAIGQYENGAAGATRMDINLTSGNLNGAIPAKTVMSLLGNGNVGIGLTDPNSTLTVGPNNGGTLSGEQTVYINSGTSSSALVVDAPGTNAVFGIQVNSESGYGVSSSSGDVAFYGSGSNYDFYGEGSSYFGYCATIGGTDYGTCSSDQRLKENITDVYFSGADTLAQVAGLRPRTYNFISDEKKMVRTGLIAQEVELVAPELVITKEDGYKAVNYGGIQWLTLKAVQELNTKLNLQSDLEIALTGEIDTLKEKISGIALIDEEQTAKIESMNLKLGALTGEIIPVAGSAEEKFANDFFANVFVKVSDWLASADNGIKTIFARKISTKLLCIADEAGVETCVEKTQLDNLLAKAGEVSASEINDVSGTNTDIPTQTSINPNAPVITLVGEATVNMDINGVYNELGANVTDDVDTFVAVSISGVPDNSTNGIYAIHYNAVDSEGNNAIELIRKVIVGTGDYTLTGVSGDSWASGDTVVGNTPEVTSDTTTVTDTSSTTTVSSGFDEGAVTSGTETTATPEVPVTTTTP